MDAQRFHQRRHITCSTSVQFNGESAADKSVAPLHDMIERDRVADI